MPYVLISTVVRLVRLLIKDVFGPNIHPNLVGDGSHSLWRRGQ